MKVAVLRGDQHRRGTILRARVDSSASLAQQRGASQRAYFAVSGVVTRWLLWSSVSIAGCEPAHAAA